MAHMKDSNIYVSQCVCKLFSLTIPQLKHMLSFTVKITFIKTTYESFTAHTVLRHLGRHYYIAFKSGNVIFKPADSSLFTGKSWSLCINFLCIDHLYRYPISLYRCIYRDCYMAFIEGRKQCTKTAACMLAGGIESSLRLHVLKSCIMEIY